MALLFSYTMLRYNTEILTLAIDIETFSSYPLNNVFKYTEAPDFEILLIGYRYDDGPVHVVDLKDASKEKIDLFKTAFLIELLDKRITKTAFNAQFEITCLSKFFKIDLNPAQWRCTMAGAGMLGLPMKLEQCAAVLKLPDQKDPKGKALIKYFTQPCKPTKVNGGRVRNLPADAPEKWAEFIEYCRKDVEVESQIRSKIEFFQVSDFEKPMYCIDQEINKRGVRIDRVLVQNAIRMNEAYTTRLINESRFITGMANPNSVAQLKAWLEDNSNWQIETLSKQAIPSLIESIEPGDVSRVLEIRQLTSKSSIKKYQAMLDNAGADDRVRGLFQYYGANRTGRWAGRQVQVQNLIKNWLPDLKLARQLVREGDLEAVELFYGNVGLVLSQLVRTAFIPSEGNVLAVSDFSAIEARVIAWLAGEKWKLDIFNGDGKIYEATGARMFNCKAEDIKKGSGQRDAAKICELALGYQGAVGALTQMIESEKYKFLERGKPWTFEPDEAEKLALVKRWRAANPRIVKLWYDTNNAVINCVETGEKITVGKVTYHIEKGVLFCTLPSGRQLSYMRPKLAPNKFDGVSVQYEGMDQTTKQWKRISAYGGLFVENITQAVARDLLAEKLKRINDTVLNSIVMHVHDEAVLDIPAGNLDAVNWLMGAPVSWAPGLPMKAEGFETLFYKKDD